MQLSILLPDGALSTIELPEEDGVELNELAVELVAAECGIIPAELKITLNGVVYSDSTSSKLSSIKFSNGDMIKVERNVLATATPRGINYLHEIPQNIKAEDLVNVVISNPRLIQQFQNADPDMYSALAKVHNANTNESAVSDSDKTECTSAVRLLMMTRALNNYNVVYEKRVEEQKIFADPFSEASQKRIAEQISQQNIQANMEVAMEEMPEAFARVHMLYVNLEVNNFPIKAFVDSGAQSTIMSARCAERCGVMRLLDKRFAGEARGVGSCKILGKVHVAQMKLGGSFFSVSLTVLENNDVDFLFGLDMLKRHRCSIDLGDNVLRIMGGSGVEEIPFLPENELPDKGTFGKDGQKVEEDTKVGAESSSGSSSSTIPPPKKQCGTDKSVSGGEGGDMLTADKITHLMSLGFPEGQSAAALRQADGDMELAANILFASMP